MTRRAEVAARLPGVLGLSEAEAAAYIGVSGLTFRGMVADGRMPKPRQINARCIYDVDEVRAAFKALPHKDEKVRGNSWADVA